MTISISIASGKGGVGKTSIAVNLALTMAMMGSRVALFDADFGLANSHLLLGLKPGKTLKDSLEASNISDVSITGPYGLRLFSGGNGLVEMLNLDQKTRYNVIRGFDSVAKDCDVMIIDTPAGASDSALTFINASDKILIVLVGEPTSFMDAYTLVKAASLEGGAKEFSIVVNMADSERHSRDIFNKFKMTVMRFLNVNINYVGYLPQSRTMRNSIIARKPMVLGYSSSKEARLIKSMSKELLRSPNNSPSGIKFFNNNSI
jgi:flagellar biosynthesis protein FlhG